MCTIAACRACCSRIIDGRGGGGHWPLGQSDVVSSNGRVQSLRNCRLHRGGRRARFACPAVGIRVSVFHRLRRCRVADAALCGDTNGKVSGNQSGEPYGPGTALWPTIAAIGVRHRKRRRNDGHPDLDREGTDGYRREFDGEPGDVAGQGTGEVVRTAPCGEREQQQKRWAMTAKFSSHARGHWGDRITYER